ncbi:MAG: hypothetical protein IJ523_08125 [Succinivibrionaceae bacterium]|nr:hypothetical protein [Succinivibrionaceae bacterium]MBQ8708039.1 hypothetical protein [Succinivibrionaceae bacterium]
MMENRTVEMRLARMEAVTAQLRAEMDDVVQNAYNQAVEDHDEQRAAELARMIRNRMLEQSDKEFSLDRLLPEAPSGASFTAWLSWLRDLAAVVSNNWAVYRKALRDLTDQEGFPFNIVWPVPPDKE